MSAKLRFVALPILSFPNSIWERTCPGNSIAAIALGKMRATPPLGIVMSLPAFLAS